MTCITAIVEKGRVYMAGDSAGVAGLDITIRDDVKVFNKGEFILGFTSSFRMGQLLRFKLNPAKQTISQTDYEYMVTDFIDACRKCFAENGFGDKDATRGGSFLVGYKGTLYSVDSDYQVGIPNLQYDACGCGESYAKGSLYSSIGKPPKERLKLALEAAAHFSAGVHAPFVFVECGEEVKIKAKKPTKTKPTRARSATY